MISTLNKYKQKYAAKRIQIDLPRLQTKMKFRFKIPRATAGNTWDRPEPMFIGAAVTLWSVMASYATSKPKSYPVKGATNTEPPNPQLS